MATTNWIEFHNLLRQRLKPYGYCDHKLLKSFDAKKLHLHDMIKRTALTSESNSVLIIGPRGCGKSALLECVIKDAFKNKNIGDNMLYIELNGLIHTDDNIALEDIARQLQIKNDDHKTLGSFTEKLRLLLSALKSGSKMSKSILFVLDNFDLFCAHKNQTLLYNLFDVAQSQQSPICVVGMSCRPDVLQVLENRVNSRFSHQKIMLFDKISFDNYIGAAEDILMLPESYSDDQFRKQWNSELSNTFKQNAVANTLKIRFDCTATLRDLKQLLLLSIMGIGESHPKLELGDIAEALRRCTQDCKPPILQGLSVLEISMVIAMMHLTEIYDGEPFNFEMVCHELEKIFHKKMMWNLEKSVVMKAYEHLLDLEIAKRVDDTSVDTQKRYMLIRLMVEIDQVKEVIDRYPNLPAQLKQWAVSSIVE